MAEDGGGLGLWPNDSSLVAFPEAGKERIEAALE
jgi:hypothetical protein